jgi:hypothetical protein
LWARRTDLQSWVKPKLGSNIEITGTTEPTDTHLFPRGGHRNKGEEKINRVRDWTRWKNRRLTPLTKARKASVIDLSMGGCSRVLQLTPWKHYREQINVKIY